MGSGELTSLTVEAYLDRLASGDPTPGGGSAAALAGALAAALVSMVCNLTLGREKYASVEPEVRRLLDRAEAVRTRLRSNVQADAAAYEGVMAAYRLPRGSDEEKERRGAAIESATRFASEIPLLVAQDCEAVLAMSEEAIGRTNPNVNSDVAAAALLARSGLEAAAASVEINIPTLKDRGLAQELRERLAALRSGLEDRVAVVVERSREHPG